ncbi:MAG: gliding motility-associated C-terminal domain-containing protein [Chitinophagaceae bacterium]|nr:gliding motility-associated C-terminal domain-containing protein [Chitinophagaceae bacterium]
MIISRLFIVPCLFLALPLITKSQLYFVENKGQWDKQVQFKTEAGNSAFFLSKDGYTILMHHPEDYQRLTEYNHGHRIDSPSKKDVTAAVPDKMRAHAFRVKFLGGNFNSTPVMEKPLPGIENYFIGNDESKWASGCKLFQAITYKNVYPGVDVRYYVQGDQLKYDIVVYPGADVSKIQMHYEGADKLSIRNNELIVGTSVGEARELKPYTFQFVEGKRETIQCRYKLAGNTVSFDIKNYDRTTTLIIDPALVFSSFSRSTTDNWGFTATPGPDGSFFGGGIAQPTGFPTSTGVIQPTGGGPTTASVPPDIGIIRLSPDGRTRMFATYLGGNGIEQPHSIIADAAGNLVIAGRTNSGNTFPGALYGDGGGYDIFVTKINSTGTAIIGSIRIGGTGDDGVNINPSRGAGAQTLLRNYGDDGKSEVILDRNNNILLASCSQSRRLFAQVAGSDSSGGRQDGIVIKINPNANTVIWSKYLGGIGEDAAFVLSVNPLSPQDIFVAGGTTSTNFPGTAAGVLQPAYNGGTADGYVTNLTDNGTTVSLLRTTYLGTAQTDLVYGIQFDQKGFPYVMGTSTGNWPVQNAIYSVANSRQFIAKLQPNLSGFVYSTTFGTSGAAAPNISPVAFLVDNCENVYVSGWGGAANNFGGGPSAYPTAGTTGLPVTSDAFQRTTDGSDFYFFVLQKNAASQLYGSFFGQLGGPGGTEHVDGGTSRFDQSGVIYQAICANCKNVGAVVPAQAPYPITAGVFGNVNPAVGGGGCNLGMVKIRFDLAGVDVALRAVGAKQLNFCLPATVQFTDTIRMAKTYIWIWGDGTRNDTTATNPFTHTYNTTGFFDVKIIGIDSNSCNVKDSATMRIRVTTDSVAVGFNYSRLACNSLTFNFTNTSNLLTSSKPFGPKSFMWVWGDGTKNDTILGFAPPVAHTFPAIGSYNVRLVLIDSGYCNLGDDSSMVNFQVIDNIRAGFSVDNVCVPDTVKIIDTSVGSLSYLWLSSDGQSSNATVPNFTYATPGPYTIKQYVFNPNSCNLIDSATRTFQAVAPPTAGFFYNPNPSQENTPTRFTSTASADVVRWFWEFGDGDTSALRDPFHQYVRPGINTVCQTVTNSVGCQDSICIPVESIINIVNDLPSAFTPNGDGVNDRFMVRGFGIAKMTLRVYNRQGLMVFESRSQNIGWDGNYKGTPQPMDAYAWTLEVEYFTGEKFKKKGDVTLIR